MTKDEILKHNGAVLKRLSGLTIMDIRRMSQEEYEDIAGMEGYSFDSAPTVIVLSDDTFIYADDGLDHGDFIRPGALLYGTHGDEESDFIEYRLTPADITAHENRLRQEIPIGTQMKVDAGQASTTQDPRKSGKADGAAIGTNLTHPKIGVGDKGFSRQKR